MKYHLETIPVWNAYTVPSECPLCVLARQAEQDYLAFFLGGSVMEPEIRVQVNRTGFCPRHLARLLKGGNRLGLALMVHTHLQETLERLREEGRRLPVRWASRRSPPGEMASRPEVAQAPACRAGAVPRLAGRGPARDGAKRFSAFLAGRVGGCLICRRIEERLQRYGYTIIHLWRTDPEFRAALQDSRGFCLAHLGVVVEMAAATLPPAGQAALLETLLPLEERSLEMLAADLEAFTRSYEYRSAGEAGPQVRAALERAVQKLSGRIPAQPGTAMGRLEEADG
jgi:hypothetical protein